MAQTTPTERAKGLVDRARRRAFGHELVSAVLAGLAVSALLAAATAATARIVGVSPGAWLLLSILPGLLLVIVRMSRRAPTPMRAALLLDAAAGTKERFAAVLTAKDAEVRELVAGQALSAPQVEGGRLPLTFPPSTEGVLAAVSLVLLGAVLLLGGGEAPPEPNGSAPAGPPLAASARPSDDPDAPVDPAAEPSPAATRDPEEILARIERGEEISEAEWEELERRGLTEEDRNAAAAAAEEGDGTAAAEAVRRALDAAEPAVPEAGPDAERDWSAYEHAMEAPVWSPRFDRVVRAYFEGGDGD